MILEFRLSMPNVGSWNGKWTGESNYYAKVVNLGKTKDKKELGNELLSKQRFYYNFGDGWGMSIHVNEISSKEATKIRKKSNGFCGYDWAVESILKHKKIITE